MPGARKRRRRSSTKRSCPSSKWLTPAPASSSRRRRTTTAHSSRKTTPCLVRATWASSSQYYVVMAGYNWNWSKAEPELKSLYEWLDGEAYYSNRKLSLMIIGVTFAYLTAFVVGASLFKFYHTGAHSAPMLMVLPMLVATAASVGGIAWYLRTTTLEQKEHTRRI